MSQRFGIDSAIFLAGLTAILYTWSTASYEGFLGVLHLNADMMERNFHQVMYSGLLIAFGPALGILFMTASALYLYSHLILPTYVDWVRASINSKRKAIKIRRFFYGKRNSPAVEIRAKVLFSKVLIVTIAGIAYILSLAFFEHKGGTEGKRILKLHHDGKPAPNSLVQAIIGADTKTLLFIGCGSENCAGIESGTSKIYYFASSSGYSFNYSVEKDHNATR